MIQAIKQQKSEVVKLSQEGRHHRILIVEDNKAQAELGLRHLSAMGHEAIWAKDGGSAIKAAAREHIDLILLDLELPDMNGIQICQWLRKNPSTRRIPIIMLTARESLEVMISGFDAGIDDFLRKPYNEVELGARIKAALRAKVLQDELEEKNRELENILVEVERLAITDHLTGLFNRRYFSTVIEREFNRVKRYKTSISCCIIDVDHFKSVNDSFGHQAGDMVLVDIAEGLKANFRNVDTVARWGGEEFIVLMSETRKEAAVEAARRLLSLIEKKDFPDIKDRKITVSIGLSSTEDTDYEDADALVRAADKALYTAKQNGRNRLETL